MLGGTRSFPLQSGFFQMWYTPIDGGDFLNLRGFSQHFLTDPMHILGIFLVITFICHSIPLYYCPMRVRWFFLVFLPPRFHVFSGFTENMFTSHVINMAGRLSHSEATAVSHVLRSWCHNLGEPLYGGYNMNITIVNGFITVYNCSWWLLMDVYGF